MNNTDHYKILHEYKNEDQFLAMNEVTGDVCVRKTLKIYDIEVYKWLRDNHPPHLPEIMELYEADGRLTVIERYIAGSTLDEYIRKNSPDGNTRLRIVNEICDGLYYLHRAPRPVIHRDIKASNILIDDNGHVTIIDFDAAKIYKRGESCDTVLLGTEGSAAPEQYGFAQSDPRTDIYSLGIMAREILPSSPRFNAVIRKATAFDPNDRYQDIRLFKQALNGKTGSLSITASVIIAVAIALVLAVFLYGVVSPVSNRSSNAAKKVIAMEDVVYSGKDISEEELQELISSPDYENAREFEKALNRGEDVDGAIVRFEATRIPAVNSTGYPNVWGGDHLNFVSSEDHHVNEGDVLTVRVCATASWGQHWFISYELLDIT